MKLKNVLNFIVSLVLIALPLGVSVFFWERLPAKIPIHFDLSGLPDGFAPKESAVFYIPGISVILLLLSQVYLWRKGQSAGNHEITINTLAIIPRIRLFVFAFLSYAGILLILRGVYPDFDLGWFLALGLDVLLIFFSAAMIHVKPNKVFGIRNKWTLASALVWEKTHRLWGRISLGGFVFLAFLSFALSGTSCLFQSPLSLFFCLYSVFFIPLEKVRNRLNSLSRSLLLLHYADYTAA
jgi:uncharacterized membrane protein